MASEVQGQNGVVNGETCTSNASARFQGEEEPSRSLVPDPTEPTHEGTRGSSAQGMHHDTENPGDVDKNDVTKEEEEEEEEEEDTSDGSSADKTVSNNHDENSTVPASTTQKHHHHPEAASGTSDPGELSEGTHPTATTQATNQDSNFHNPGSNVNKDGAGERPVRQKLKETSIAGNTARALSPDDESMAYQGSNSPVAPENASETNHIDERGRLRRKRSIDDVHDDDATSGAEDTGHRRKRSRSSKAEDSPEDSTVSQRKSDTEIRDSELQNGPLETRDAEVGMCDEIARVHTPPPTGELSAAEKLLSPKKKRSIDQLRKDDLKSADVVDSATGVTSKDGEPADKVRVPSLGNRTLEGEPEKKRHRDNSQERAVASEKASLPNPFANTSAVSPFASIPASKSTGTAPSEKPSDKEQPRSTSATAFATSSLAAFASSEQSPFGSLVSSGSASPFKSAVPQSTETATAKEPAAAPPPSSSAFAASPFATVATTSSPFGSFGGGFGTSAFSSGFGTAAAPAKFGSGLTSFAAPGGPGVLGSSKPKVLGAAPDVEEEEAGDNEKPGFEGLEDEKEDERFFKQETETGEEGETTYFSCRGKLFQFDGKEWKERGVGTFKVNVTEPRASRLKKDDGEERSGTAEDKAKDQQSTKTAKKTARFIMRADGVWRVILNSPIIKGMKAGDAKGEEPTGKQVHLAGIENGKSVPLLLRTPSADAAKDLYHWIQDVQASL
ncbi:hypothetical protein AJ80_05115 [Polytolypa hystricis UAMH7299]|uniref:RanBD1 domain-containing protein n=1 Tax=Polytolypa hystricis (strain UAMH7299) TaxID=1447883 RepID=A0A2B7Y6E9_POLH7|nr:hypothetical protein AJ80_05115 [Polytolypa hystricis UAMH7299]